MAIQIKSRKAKARRLQNYIRDKLRTIFKRYQDNMIDKLKPLNIAFYETNPEENIKDQVMGQSGSDIILSSAAKEIFPITIECKNQEGFENIYKAWHQAVTNTKVIGEKSVVVIKSNKRIPLAIID